MLSEARSTQRCPGSRPLFSLTCHLITYVLAFIITNAKSDFAPFEDSGSTNRSIIISQNNYVALKERGKKKSNCWILLSCDRDLPAVGPCCVKQCFMAVWSCFILMSSTHCSICPISRSGSRRAPPSSPIPFSPALQVLTFKSKQEPLHVWGTWRRTRAC